MRVSVLFVPVLTALASPPQHRWQAIGKTSTGNPVFIDARSVTRAGAVATAVVRVVYVEPVATPRGTITSVRATAMFDCSRRLVASKETTLFLDERANRVFQHTVVGKPGFGPALSSTFADVAMRHLCR